MPKRPDRTREVERQVASLIAELRQRRGWSYAQIAEQMTAAGCPMHPSGVQRTEVAERRVTVEELVAYARVFDTSVDSLLFAETGDLRTQEYWRDLLAAERAFEVLRVAQRNYDELVRGVRLELRRNPILRGAIQNRYDQHLANVKPRAVETADVNGEDVSTPDKLTSYIEVGFLTPALAACSDVLDPTPAPTTTGARS